MTMQIRQLVHSLEVLADSFGRAVYAGGDTAAALACVTDSVEVANLPHGVTARGAAELRRRLDEDLAPHLPPDLTFRRVSRTADQRRLVDESVVAFTHDRALPWLLPGVPATGRPVEVLAITVVSAEHRSRLGLTTTLIDRHRTLWDYAGLLAQLRLDPADAAALLARG
ncbi:nuclear transport factor 2 family protein [Pseudonocardia humida]|uniref:Nuclear transport factor 2 family protein n=1 Tax=Pseudonocardia humida TaxID=2800819 RepID=A0ABT0ZZM7_9PSEU|nr:nuclear transport factor 2 family protein [Pseudonocardia humida]MCO1656202.1 nuclear transport factor 2 family protein [Pseudonocardia humida]